jgi:ribonuclease T1
MLRAFLALLLALICGLGQAREGAYLDTIRAAELPPEARQVMRLIDQGGPFPYRRDGVVFGNYEKRLPLRFRGYYHEYTVPTPGAHDRGARRIISGNEGERYYTPDHYRHFLSIQP